MEIIDFTHNEEDKRWVVKHKCRDEEITAEHITLMKEYRRADLVLKKDGILIFVEEIPIAEFEDIKEVANEQTVTTEDRPQEQ